jgi:enoyl-CoA hydratase/carnithine racemase
VDAVVRSDDEGVSIVSLNRPERRNALSTEVVAALGSAVDAAAADPSVRAIVLRGEGKHFCAGGDLAGGLSGDGLVAGERARGAYGDLLLSLVRCPVPVIAAVHGAAMGGGLGLVAAADLAVVEADARLGTPEVKVGLFPYVISAVLQRAVPRKALLAMVLGGESVDGEEAVRLGLANRVSAPGEATAEALAWAKRLAAASKATIALGKAAFHDAADLPLEAALRVLNNRLTVGLLTEDASEGLAAFVGKRAPVWSDR